VQMSQEWNCRSGVTTVTHKSQGIRPLGWVVALSIELDWIKGTVGSDTNLPLVELLEKCTNCSSGSHMVYYGSLMEGVGRDSAEDNSHRGDVPNNGDGLP
jgi:hypothetical protein